MKIIILAAGIGSRLGNPFPKPLTPLNNGKSIMQMQIENLTGAFSIDDIQVVVGFKKDLIMERFPEVTYIYNPFFDRTNTSKSLLKALRKNKDKSILWLNGDVVFDASLLEVLMPYIQKETSFVAVNTDKVGDEEVKYTLKNGVIHELSKTVKNGLGEAVGINFISAKSMPAFIQRLETAVTMIILNAAWSSPLRKTTCRSRRWISRNSIAWKLISKRTWIMPITFLDNESYPILSKCLCFWNHGPYPECVIKGPTT